jgi:hypothetical protein
MDVLLILLGVWLVLAVAFFALVRALGFVAERSDRQADRHAADAMHAVARPPGRKREAREPAEGVARAHAAPIVRCDDCRVTMELPPGRALLCPSCRKLLVPAPRAAAA